MYVTAELVTQGFLYHQKKEKKTPNQALLGHNPSDPFYVATLAWSGIVSWIPVTVEGSQNEQHRRKHLILAEMHPILSI